MKFFLMSFLLLNSAVVLADASVCTNAQENLQVRLEEGKLTVNNESYDCMELSETECTVINFETTEVTKLTLSDKKDSGVLEIMPAPGSGEIKATELLCN